MPIRRISIIISAILSSVLLAIDLPTWHESDIENKSIAPQFNDPLVSSEVGYSPKIQTAEEYQNFILAEQQKFETPLQLLASSSVNILSDLDRNNEETKKAASQLAILNDRQPFELKFILTEEKPSQFKHTLPQSIEHDIAIVVLNPERLSNQTQISYSSKLADLLDATKIRNFRQKSNELSIKNTSISGKIDAISKHLSVELRSLLSSDQPTSPIIAPTIVSVEPLELPEASFVDTPLANHEIKAASATPISDNIDSAAASLKNSLLTTKNLISGSILLILILIGAFIFKTKFAPKKCDIALLKDRYGIDHQPSFGATRGAYITEAVNFGAQLPSNPNLTNHNKGKVL